jgi:hypothetical protein
VAVKSTSNVFRQAYEIGRVSRLREIAFSFSRNFVVMRALRRVNFLFTASADSSELPIYFAINNALN